MLHAATEAVAQGGIPEGSHLHFISDLSFLTDLLNEDRAARRATGYLRKSKPRRPLAYADKWRELDAALDKLNLTVSAGRPLSDESRWPLGGLKLWATEIRRNIGRDPSEWGVR